MNQIKNTTASSTILLLALASFPILLIFMDYAAISVIFPEIAATFNEVQITDLSWVLNGYVIFGAALVIPFGRLSDQIGRKKIYIIGLLIFSAGCLMNIIAISYIMVILARILQGIGSAMLLPSAISIILSSFDKADQAKYFGVTSATGAFSAAIGPLLYSLISQLANWRVAFVVPLALALFCLVLAKRHLTEYLGTKSQAQPDYFDIALIILAIGLLSLFIVKINSWGFSAKLILALLVAIVLFAIFLYNCQRKKNPVIDLSLFKIKSVVIGDLLTAIVGIFFSVYGLASVYFLKDIWGYSQWQIGIGLMIGPLASIPSSIIAGRLGSKYGFKWLLIIGLAIFALLGLFRLLTFDFTENFWLIWLPAQIIGGFGIGLMLTALVAYSDMWLPKSSYSTGSAINSSIRQVGAVFGTAIAILAIDAAKDNSLPLKLLFLSMAISGALSIIIIVISHKIKYTNMVN